VVSEIKIEMQKSMDNNMNNDDDSADNTLLIPSHRNFRDITDSFNGHLLFNGIYIYAGILFSFQIVIEEHY
jgi:hypothetical protein